MGTFAGGDPEGPAAGGTAATVPADGCGCVDNSGHSKYNVLNDSVAKEEGCVGNCNNDCNSMAVWL